MGSAQSLEFDLARRSEQDVVQTSDGLADRCAELPPPEKAADLGVYSNAHTEAKTDEAAVAARDWLDRFVAARQQRRNR